MSLTRLNRSLIHFPYNCKDFFQLPPVFDKTASPKFDPRYAYPEDPPFLNKTFCFKAKCWDRCFPKANHFELVRVFRQDNSRFVKILNEIRIGKLSQASVSLLSNNDKKLPRDDGIIPTKLFSINKDVDRMNFEKLDEINAVEVKFYAIDNVVIGSNWNDTDAEAWGECPSPSKDAQQQQYSPPSTPIVFVGSESNDCSSTATAPGPGIMLLWVFRFNVCSHAGFCLCETTRHRLS